MEKKVQLTGALSLSPSLQFPLPPVLHPLPTFSRLSLCDIYHMALADRVLAVQNAVSPTLYPMLRL